MFQYRAADTYQIAGTIWNDTGLQIAQNPRFRVRNPDCYQPLRSNIGSGKGYLRIFPLTCATVGLYSTPMAGESKNSVVARSMTLRDIAKQINVDVGTVSRALAGDGRVGKERADHIRSFAQAMGYRPRPLRRKRADAIGLVMRAADMNTPQPGHHERMLYLAEVGANRLNKHLHVHMFKNGEERAEWPKFLAENRVDGMIVVGHGSSTFYDRLRREPVPTVALNDTVEHTDVDCVMCDPTQGMRDAVGRLLGLGHRSIGLVLTRRQYPTVSRRYSAYMAAMAEAGVEPDPQWIVQDVPDGLRGGQQAVRTYAANGSMPSAIIFNDDGVAFGGVYELARRGMMVPTDISVVGYDNSAMSAEQSPSLSSIDNQEQHLMDRALAMLQERIDGLDEPPRQETVDSRLVWRESCTVAKA